MGARVGSGQERDLVLFQHAGISRFSVMWTFSGEQTLGGPWLGLIGLSSPWTLCKPILDGIQEKIYYGK